jgi:hypothetical protein
MDTFGSGSVNDYHAKRERKQMKCLDCGVELSSEWITIQDAIQLCHLCYEKQFSQKGESK